MALNHLNTLEQYIEDENQLLWEWVKQLEHKTVVVIGKPTQTNTLQQDKALSLTNEGHPEQVDPNGPYKIGKRNSKKTELETAVELESLEIWPRVTQKKPQENPRTMYGSATWRMAYPPKLQYMLLHTCIWLLNGWP